MPVIQEVKQATQQETLPYARALLVGFCENKIKWFTQNMSDHYILVAVSIPKARAEMKRKTKPVIVVLNAQKFSVNEIYKFSEEIKKDGIGTLAASSFGNSTTADGVAIIGLKEAIKKTKEKIQRHTPTL